MTVLAGTGHRPEKLGGYSIDAFQKLRVIARSYLQEARPKKVISGMALGWDQAWAQAALDLDIPLIAAIPFSDQHSRWSAGARRFFWNLRLDAEKVVVVSKGGYAATKMQRRNEWMVDNSDGVVAMWDGSASGTLNCLLYAAENKKPIRNLYSEWKEMADAQGVP